MRRKGSALNLTSERKAKQAATILDEAILRWSQSQEPPDFDALKSEYAFLLPELDQAIENTRWIFDAAEKAKEKPRKHPHSIPIDNFPGLREALSAYEIQDQIHYGGQGVVYRAIQLTTNRHVALKIFLGGLNPSIEERIRFEREAELCSRLTHPNIVTLYEAGVAAGRLYFAMEYIDGLNIEDHTLLHDLTVREIVELFVDVCRAVAAAHAGGVIHRDLHPANIVVDEQGVPHLLDFGLAKEVGKAPDSRVSQPNMIMGVLKYMSPEHVGAGANGTDVHSDVYSLGVILYQLLTESFPYDVVGEFGYVREQIVNREPMPLRRAFAEADPERRANVRDANRDLEAILQRALAKDKTARYPSPNDFADDLERFLKGEAVDARAKHRWYMLRKTLRRYRVAVGAVAAIFLVFSVATGMVWSALLNARAATKLAFNEFDASMDTLDRMTTLVGGRAMRGEALEGVDERLSTLAEHTATDPDILQRIDERRGDVALESGRHAQAVAHYEQSLEGSLAQWNARPHTDASAATIVRAYRKLAEATDQPEKYYPRAQQFFRNEAESVAAQATRFELFAFEVQLGDSLRGRDRREEALKHLDATIALYEKETVRSSGDWDGLAAHAFRSRGQLLNEEGWKVEADRDFQRSIAILEHRQAANPANGESRMALAMLLGRVATFYNRNNDTQKAIELLEKSVAHWTLLNRFDPGAYAWAKQLIMTRTKLAEYYLRDGREDASYAQADLVEQSFESMWTRFRDNSDLLETYMAYVAMRGKLLVTLGHRGAAIDAFNTAIETLGAMAEAEPENERLHRMLGSVYQRLSRVLSLAEDRTGALRAARQAVPHARHFYRQNPDSIRAIYELATAKTNFAGAAAKIGAPHVDEATRALDEAGQLLDSAPVNIETEDILAIRSQLYESIKKTRGKLESAREQ